MKYILLVSATIIFLLTSCYKEKSTVATITVVNNLNQGIENARVVLLGVCDPCSGQNIERSDTLFTNVYGEARFDYTNDFDAGSAGFAVLNIFVEKEVNGVSLSNQGVIKVDSEMNNSETIVLH